MRRYGGSHLHFFMKNILNSVISQGSSVAIVGNGGSLKEKKDGNLIDSFDVVVRFNNFHISEQYIKHVGSKTDFWSNTFYKDIKSRKEDLPILCPLPLNMPGFTELYDTNISLMMSNFQKTTFIPEYIYQDLCELMPNHKTRKRKDPSSGLCMIFWFLESGFTITKNNLFGFDFFSSTNHHYFSHGKSPSENHEGHVEKEILKSLII
jgi:hypothetical protein